MATTVALAVLDVGCTLAQRSVHRPYGCVAGLAGTVRPRSISGARRVRSLRSAGTPLRPPLGSATRVRGVTSFTSQVTVALGGCRLRSLVATGAGVAR